MQTRTNQARGGCTAVDVVPARAPAHRALADRRAWLLTTAAVTAVPLAAILSQEAAASGAGTVTTTPTAITAHQTITAGDWLNLGWDFSIGGSHPAATVNLSNIVASFPVSCTRQGPWITVTTTIPNSSATVAANDSHWSPTDQGASPAGYQAAVRVPDKCNGKPMWLPSGSSSGVTYTAHVTSTDTTNAFQFRFHAIDANSSSNQGNINCSSPPSTISGGTCNGSWSSNIAAIPVAPPSPAPIPTPIAAPVPTTAKASGGSGSVGGTTTATGGIAATGSAQAATNGTRRAGITAGGNAANGAGTSSTAAPGQAPGGATGGVTPASAPPVASAEPTVSPRVDNLLAPAEAMFPEVAAIAGSSLPLSWGLVWGVLLLDVGFALLFLYRRRRRRQLRDQHAVAAATGSTSS